MSIVASGDTKLNGVWNDGRRFCLSHKRKGCPYQWIETREDSKKGSEVTEPRTKISDFSIESILKTESINQIPDGMYDWLTCTRYKPPKLKRARRQDGLARRKLGRNPRIPFSSEQVIILENKFRQNAYLSCADVAALSSALRLSEIRIKIWFQNRRARERRERETGCSSLTNPTKFSSTAKESQKYQPLITSSESAFVPCQSLKRSSQFSERSPANHPS